MKALRLNSVVVGAQIKARMHYPGLLVADSLTVLGRFGILVLLYQYVFALRGSEILGISFPIAAWSMFFYFALMMLGIRNVARAIMRDVRSGNIEMLINKPFSYLSFRATWQLGEGVYPFILTSFIGGVAMYLLVGLPPVMRSVYFMSSFLMVMVLGIILSLLVYTLVGVVAFWIEDINPIYWIIDKAVMILGGSYLPIGFFPPLMYQVALWSPFGASYFATHSVYENWPDVWMSRVFIQVVWILVLSTVTGLMFVRAKRNLSINGG